MVLPLNLYSARKSWFDSDSFLISTANGFVGPSHSLVLHTMMSIFVAVAMMAVVYQLRQFLLRSPKPPPTHSCFLVPAYSNTASSWFFLLV